MSWLLLTLSRVVSPSVGSPLITLAPWSLTLLACLWKTSPLGACSPGMTTPTHSTHYPFLPHPHLPHVLSRTPWVLSLPPLPSITASVTPALMSSPSCWAAQSSPDLKVEMIPCVMSVSLVGMFGCPFLPPRPEPFDPLTSYIVTSGPPLFWVPPVTSITWSSCMTALTTRGPFCYVRSPTPSPPLPFLRLCVHAVCLYHLEHPVR
jgi:hypothetical protein